MKFKPILFFLLISVALTSAVLPPKLVVNDELKQCKVYHPHGQYDLPEGWEYYEQSSENYKEDCESLDHTYIDEPLQGVKKPIYPVLYTALNILLLISLAISYFFIIKKFIKNKNKNYLELVGKLVLALIVIVMIYYILKFLIYPCNHILC